MADRVWDDEVVVFSDCEYVFAGMDALEAAVVDEGVSPTQAYEQFGGYARVKELTETAVVQIGAVKYDLANRRVVETFEVVVDPGESWPAATFDYLARLTGTVFGPGHGEQAQSALAAFDSFVGNAMWVVMDNDGAVMRRQWPQLAAGPAIRLKPLLTDTPAAGLNSGHLHNLLADDVKAAAGFGAIVDARKDAQEHTGLYDAISMAVFCALADPSPLAGTIASLFFSTRHCPTSQGIPTVAESEPNSVNVIMSETQPLVVNSWRQPAKGGHKNRDGGEGTSSTTGAIFNFLSTTISTGLLSLPGAGRDGGWVAIVMIVGVALVANHTAQLLVACLDAISPRRADDVVLFTSHDSVVHVESGGTVPADNHEISYAAIGRAAYGTPGAVVVGVLQIALLFGACTIFLVLFGNLMSELFDCVSPHIFIIGLVVFMIPLSWLRSLSEVALLSYGGLAASMLTWAIICGYGISDGIQKPVAGGRPILVLANGPVAFNTVVFAFAGHSVLPSIYSSMARPQTLARALNYAFTVIAIVYSTITACGYWAYGSKVGGPSNDIFWNMPTTIFTRIAASALSAHLACAYLVPFNPVAHALERVILPASPDGLPGGWLLRQRMVIRTPLVVASAVVAVSVPFFGELVSLFAAFSVMAMVFTLPPIFFAKLYPERVSRSYAVVLIAIVSLGLIGTGLGLTYASANLVKALRDGGNPFANFLARDCRLN
ncbi:uncharacterized protein AMSG_12277 [Thecamonas trahens ATCC 50062]|uniref:Amino acid transporter transmembrane domain-containing protein n=1 Tax=Thecamonas trahens ATCC 50062 TaxID=461836 RepID=A0A0L0DR82_THETB|nr:hypothetical protein AMSG_12277 [Thecamonas trahens ATCC 50062]KNC53953.1 hypothetical protein AMSG_12277 [Thecamonas trahens ATCC 50062]|eukprot:XP_013754204.1 hypothetical protein AMSG_12277 [Thecamonas trahens ATCC 50062]